jgi:carbamoyltransferase
LTTARPIVLGVCSGTHDSAAALVVDDRLVGLAEEERFNGDKHTRAYPREAVGWLLGEAGITAWDVTHVAYNFAPRRYLAAVPGVAADLARPVTRSRAIPRARSFLTVHRRAAARMAGLARRFPDARIHGVGHHQAHGFHAFASSGYDRAAVLIVDSLGETATTTIADFRRDGAAVVSRPLRTIADPASLGYAYGAVTQHLGWRRGDEEGTVMALAALGDPARFREVMARAIRPTRRGFSLDPSLLPLRVLSSRWPRVSAAFTAQTCPAREPGDEIQQVHADLAAALQERTEQLMVALARHAKALTGASFLCLGGGVAMNCVSVGKIADTGLFDEVHVPSAPGDSGTAAGAALALHQRITGTGVSGVSGRCYLGPDHPEVKLNRHPRPGLKARPSIRPVADHIARQLADGLIVGLFQGRLEAGPRALGNRSILASPLDRDVVARLNDTVKFREPFRPFAPVVLADKASDYFTLRQPSPFMSIASGVTDLTRDTIPAVVHVNDTARVQTLTREHNPFLAEVLTAFAELTGVPVLINTSLNIKGKPICGTPAAALDCLAESGLDALLLEGWWVTTE